jgi:signal transduction histidine kinase/CheY-like chemotaxis protein
MSPDEQYPASAKFAASRDGPGKIGPRLNATFTAALVLFVVSVALATRAGRDDSRPAASGAFSNEFIEMLAPITGAAGVLALLACYFEVRRYVKQTIRADSHAQAAIRVAAETDEFKNAFLANVSHEIRTPLAAMLGYADMLHSGSTTAAAERDQWLCTIRRSGDHLLTIVNDILDLSKIEAGRMTTEPISCSVQEVIAEVASLFRPVAVERGLYFEVKYLDAIPERVRTDPTRLRQALMNVIGNAVKFTERGGVRLLVDLAREADAAPLLRVRVVDTGIGMAPEVAARLFQPFVQGDVATTRRFGGTGLGLTISRQFVEMLGGAISVESEVGRGSTFTLTVATGDLEGVAMLTGVEESSREISPPASVVPPRLDGARVLVAEDGPDNQQIIGFHLRQAGAEVTLAENGKVAVQLAIEAADADRPFDLIVMDMQMPVMDGYVATTKLRDRPYTGPIIALTANAMTQDRQKCLTAGCNAFVTKPIQWELFWETIRRFVIDAGGAAARARALARVSADDSAAAWAAEAFPPAARAELARLNAQFAAALPGRVTEVREAFQREDRVKLRSLAHSLSGAAAMFGYPEASQIARELDLYYDADPIRIADLIKELDASVFRSLIPRAA